MVRFDGKKWIKENQGKHFCQCGCGQAITIQIHHHAKGIPRFINYHASKALRYLYANYGAANGRYKGGTYVDQKGYVQVRVDAKARGSKSHYVRKHRLIVEEKLKRRLARNEVVHHKNKIKCDNSEENLELMSNSEHSSIHAQAGEIGFRLLQKQGKIWYSQS